MDLVEQADLVELVEQADLVEQTTTPASSPARPVEQTMVVQITPHSMPMVETLQAAMAETLTAMVVARPDALVLAPAKYPQEKTK